MCVVCLIRACFKSRLAAACIIMTEPWWSRETTGNTSFTLPILLRCAHSVDHYCKCTKLMHEYKGENGSYHHTHTHTHSHVHCGLDVPKRRLFRPIKQCMRLDGILDVQIAMTTHLLQPNHHGDVLNCHFRHQLEACCPQVDACKPTHRFLRFHKFDDSWEATPFSQHGRTTRTS